MSSRLIPQISVPADLARARSEEEQGAFFAAALDRTLSAEARVDVVERCFAIAGDVLCLRFAGESMVQSFTRALSHLEVPVPARPDAVFHVWDSRSTGVEMLPPPFAQDCLTSRGEIWTMASRQFRSAYLWGEYALNLFESNTATGIYWTPTASLPDWAKASPLRCLLHWWAQSKGCQLVHAAAVGDERGAVLITGKSGVGKSTAALACLEQGLSYLGDDLVLLQLDPVPRVHSLYATAKLHRRQLGRFPRLAGLEGDDEVRTDGKAVLYLHPAMRERLARSLPLRAIVTPRITGRVLTELEAVEPRDLRRAASLTTLAHLPQAGPETHGFIARLVERLPGFRLALGSDLDALPGAVAGLLERSGRESGRHVPGAAGGPPLVSVIVLAGEDGRLLADSLGSVLAQKDVDTEIVLVEDARCAGIDDVVSRLPVEVRRLQQQQGGPAAGCNRGVRECAGALVTFLRAGDRWPDGALRRMIDSLLGDGGCDVVRGCDDSGGSATALYRREAFQRVGPFREWLWDAEQSDWFDRARAHGLTLRRLARATLMARPPQDDEGRRLQHDRGTLRLLKAMLDRDRAGGSSAS